MIHKHIYLSIVLQWTARAVLAAFLWSSTVLPVAAQLSGGTLTLTGAQVLPVVGIVSGGTFSGSSFVQSAVTGSISGGSLSFTTGPAISGSVTPTPTSPASTGGIVPPPSTTSGHGTSPSTPQPSPATNTNGGQQDVQISNVRVLFISQTSAVVVFDTSIDALAAVRHSSVNGGMSVREGDIAAKTHSVALESLQPGTEYVFSISVFANGKEVVFENETYRFVTLLKPVVTPTPSPKSARKPAQSKTPSRTSSSPTPAASPAISPTPTASAPQTAELLPVENFQAAADESGSARLSWKNPASQSPSQQVVIRWSSEDFPMTVTDGDLIYQGGAEEYLQSEVNLDEANYYTAFITDGNGHFSPGRPVKILPPQETPAAEQVNSENQKDSHMKASAPGQGVQTDCWWNILGLCWYWWLIILAILLFFFFLWLMKRRKREKQKNLQKK